MEQNTHNTALLVMDMQQGVVPMLGGSSSAIIGSVSKAITNARAKQIPLES